MIGVGVIGLGVGEQHARAYHAHPACRVAAVCDLDGERAQRVAAEVGGADVVPNFDSLLARPDIAIVSIATFDDAHAEQVRRALDAGKHVFVEKPLCRTRAELDAIRAAWARHEGRLHLFSNVVLRAAPLYRWLKERIDAGAFGRIYAFDGDYLYGRLEKITGGWRSAQPDYSVMQGGGIHLIDLMLWLTGRRPAMVTAVGNGICTEGTAFRGRDFVAATFWNPGEMVARITANFGSVHHHQHVVRIFGERATFIYDDAGPRLHTSRDPAVGATAIELPPLPATKGDLIPDFVSAIVERRDFRAETQSIFDGIALTLACDESLETSQAARVEY